MFDSCLFGCLFYYQVCNMYQERNCNSAKIHSKFTNAKHRIDLNGQKKLRVPKPTIL